MSKDSSSSTKKPLLRYQRILRAVVFTVFVVLVFLTAQFVGVVIMLLALLALGYSQTQVTTVFEENVALQFLGVLFVQLATIAILYGLYRSAKRPFLQSIRLKKRLPGKKDIQFALTAYALYFAAFVVVATAASVLLPGLDTEQAQQLGFIDPNKAELVFVFASLVLLPAFAEEVIFRGVLYQGLKRYISLAAAVVVSSLIFGAAHLEFLSGSSLNWIAAIDTALFGGFLILAYEKADSLWSPILLHGLKNTVAFVVLFVI